MDLTILVTISGYDADRNGDHEDAALTVCKAIETNTDFGAVAEVIERPTAGDMERALANFAAEVSMDLDKGLSGYGPGAVRYAAEIARMAGIEPQA